MYYDCYQLAAYYGIALVTFRQLKDFPPADRQYNGRNYWHRDTVLSYHRKPVNRLPEGLELKSTSKEMTLEKARRLKYSTANLKQIPRGSEFSGLFLDMAKTLEPSVDLRRFLQKEAPQRPEIYEEIQHVLQRMEGRKNA